MATLAVGMLETRENYAMPTASVGMATPFKHCRVYCHAPDGRVKLPVPANRCYR
jgi:hypothetical protein